jgi:hypothetical protein
VSRKFVCSAASVGSCLPGNGRRLAYWWYV